MTDSVNYDLKISHFPNGHTKLTTPLYWGVYDEDGKIINAGVSGDENFQVPLPSRIVVEGRPKRKVEKEVIKSILRDQSSDSDTRSDDERYRIDIIDSDGPISLDHGELFEKLKDVLRQNAPEDGHYALNLQFFPDDDENKEHEIIEPSDIELATILAFFNFFNKN